MREKVTSLKHFFFHVVLDFNIILEVYRFIKIIKTETEIIFDQFFLQLIDVNNNYHQRISF